jgi:integrase/recombinase XerD
MQRQGMMTFTELAPSASELPEPFTGRLRLAVAAYLARFKGSSRAHTESDLRCYLAWCAERGLDPLAARRPHLELCIRWMQEIRRFKPSTVSRWFSVVAGIYRTCVLDGPIEHSPAEHVRRPAVPAELLVRRGRRAGRRPHRRRCGIASAAGCQRIQHYLDKRPGPCLG